MPGFLVLNIEHLGHHQGALSVASKNISRALTPPEIMDSQGVPALAERRPSKLAYYPASFLLTNGKDRLEW